MFNPNFDVDSIKKNKKKGEALWMLSFTDMSLVLLCFFALMLSMSSLDKTRYENLKEGMKSESGGQTKESLDKLAEKIRQEIHRRRLQDFAEVKLDIDGLAVELKDRLLFAPGSDQPNKQTAEKVKGVLAVIAKAPTKYKVLIEGHTDDTPMRGGKYPTNWELSSARSLAMMRTLKGLGVKEERSSIVAFAHTQPRFPVTGLKGDALQKARAGNRRVVIRLE